MKKRLIATLVALSIATIGALPLHARPWQRGWERDLPPIIKKVLKLFGGVSSQDDYPNPPLP